MAKHLNRSRIRDTKIVLIVCLVLMIFTKQKFPEDTPLHETLDMLGSLLIGLCVAGRIYSTAFLGGHKNKALIDYGPFSVTRNPLYFSSFLGICGIAMMSNHLILMVLLPLLFGIMYQSLIQREESYLRNEFGEAYIRYCARVPCFFPKFSRYRAPSQVPMVPQYLLYGVMDGLAWFVVLPLFELIEKAQDMQLITPLFTLY